MPKKKQPGQPVETPSRESHPEIISPVDPDELVIPEDDPDLIPDEDPFETPPYELPLPGEGP